MKINIFKAARRKRCDICKKVKADTKRQVNPYEEDVNGKTVMQNICDECIKDLIDDI